MLKESDWLTINRTLLELYAIEHEKEFQKKLLNMFHILVPYTQGFWVTYNEDMTINEEHSTYDGMKEEVFKEYAEHYYTLDYLKFTFDMTHRVMLYRDTDVMEDELRRKTEIYRNYLLPNNIPYCSGLILSDGERIFSLLALFRSKEIGDFADRDIYVMNVVKSHILNMALKLRGKNLRLLETRQEKLEKFILEYNLTAREKEIVQSFMQGKTYAQIGDALSISESTVKKHIRNIYDKTGAQNRVQLLTKME